MRQSDLERGFVLHRRDFSNTSLLLEVFTASHGRLPLIAKGVKGARRGRAALAALLQPFQPLWLTWSGRGEVATLTAAEAGGTALPLAGDGLYCGFYVNELLLRLLGRADPHPGLFVFYQQVLDGLGAPDTAPLDLVLRRFELRLLGELGYQLDLGRDAAGAPVDPALRYLYHGERGLQPAPPDQTQAPTGTALVSGATLALLATETALPGPASREARALLRAALAPHLGERPLASRALFRRGG